MLANARFMPFGSLNGACCIAWLDLKDIQEGEKEGSLSSEIASLKRWLRGKQLLIRPR